MKKLIIFTSLFFSFNYQNLFSNNIISKNIFIKQWYSSIWAIIIYILIFSLIVFFIIILIKKRIKKSKLHLEELVEIRTAEILVQKHELDYRKYEMEKAFNEMMLVNTQLNKHKEEIQEKTKKLQKQAKELELANSEIKASIRYAKKIQQSILPIENSLDECFENFIVYLPKDIVSGDFYWHSVVQDSIFFDEAKSLIFIAVIDCTGHGVPGAFMSVIGNNLLNEIINEKEIHETDEILELLNKNVQRVLQQEQTENADGMDVCLCRFERKKDKTILSFSGAKRPLILYQKKRNKLSLIKGDRKTIGGKYYQDLDFSKKEIVLLKGDTVYLTTDGFVDQNGKGRKKFGTVRFLKLLNIIAKRSLENQRKKIEFELEDHKTGVEQRDDITIMGIKI